MPDGTSGAALTLSARHEVVLAGEARGLLEGEGRPRDRARGSRPATSRRTSTGMVRAVRTARCATSYTMPPLLQIARPWPPTSSHSVSIQRIGRPVVKTTGTPRSSRAVEDGAGALGDGAVGVEQGAVEVGGDQAGSRGSLRSHLNHREPALAPQPPSGNQRPSSTAAPSSYTVSVTCVGGVADLLDGLAHGDPAAGPAQHLDVVAAVADGQHVARVRRRARRRRAGARRPWDAHRGEVEPGRPADDVVGARAGPGCRPARRSRRRWRWGRG